MAPDAAARAGTAVMAADIITVIIMAAAVIAVRTI